MLLLLVVMLWLRCRCDAAVVNWGTLDTFEVMIDTWTRYCTFNICLSWLINWYRRYVWLFTESREPWTKYTLCKSEETQTMSALEGHRLTRLSGRRYLLFTVTAVASFEGTSVAPFLLLSLMMLLERFLPLEIGNVWYFALPLLRCRVLPLECEPLSWHDGLFLPLLLSVLFTGTLGEHLTLREESSEVSSSSSDILKLICFLSSTPKTWQVWANERKWSDFLSSHNLWVNF